MFNFRKVKYLALPTSSDSLPTEDKEVGLTKDECKRQQSISWFGSFTVFLIVACTAFNLASIFPTHNRETTTSHANLPRPNQFIGLDKVNFTEHPFPEAKITTFPWVLASVDKSRPNHVFPSDPRRKFTYFGTISPEDRNFLATNEISTIAQFRTRDWGMEWCRFKLSLPGDAEHQPNVAESDRERDWLLEGDTTDLEVWELDAPYWIDLGKLSYDNKPKRKAHIFSFRVPKNRTLVSREFRCPADAIGSFEFFCVSPGCRIDIWQDKQLPAIGLSLEQRSSV